MKSQEMLYSHSLTHWFYNLASSCRHYSCSVSCARITCRSQSFFRSASGLNPEFSFSSTGCHTKVKEPSLSYYLPIAGRRKVVFRPFRNILAPSEMQLPLQGFELGLLRTIQCKDDNFVFKSD